MKVTEINLKDAYLVSTPRYEDERGFFLESFNLKKFREATGIDDEFVQDNHSKSVKGVLRGLHYQIQHSQGKLIRCTQGSVYDVIVDLRKSSPTFGKWFGIKLCTNNIHLWVPPGFAHGFYVLSESAEINYKQTDYYYPEYDRTLLWNDTDIDIDWPIDSEPILSPKDKLGKSFAECDLYE
jgi:dTDP-4-dehydrorhamnose 3,5-epimerase